MTTPDEKTADFSMLSAQHGESQRKISIYKFSDITALEMPETLDSLEALIFCGFDANIASTVIIPEWECRNALIPGRERTRLINEALQWMREQDIDDDAIGEEGWRANLERLGLSADLIRRFMQRRLSVSPLYRRMIYAESPRVWACNSVKEAYAYLKHHFKREKMKSSGRIPISLQERTSHATPVYSTSHAFGSAGTNLGPCPEAPCRRRSAFSSLSG